MNPAERHRLAMELFDELCEAAPEQRETILNQRCADDSDLRRDVEAMLEHDGAEHALFKAVEDSRSLEMFAAAMSDELGAPNAYVGGYRIVRKIGEGGMGEVFEAEQESPRRRVALKVIRAGSLTPQLVRRFEHEAQILGQLQHPGIAHIYESGMVGASGRQQPFFAMEFIDGEPITRYADEQDLDVRQRLALMVRVCDAVNHAHQRGVIHRDLKPANILVVAHNTATDSHRSTSGTSSRALDTVGQPKILDFGIARVTDSDVQAATMQTDIGQLVGTLAYMSPEQVAGDSSKLDTRCDVYALGVVTFQLLTGRLPIDIVGRSVAEAARIIRDDDPAPASTIDRSLRGDVDTIIAKALEKDPNQRYESAAELAADIRRYLADEPIVARPASAMYNIRKFARRNKGLVAGLVAAFVVLLLGVTGTTIGLAAALRANRKLEQTNTALARTNRELDQTNQELDKSNANLKEVADFQSAQLTGIDVPKMGLQLRRDLLDALPEERRDAVESQISGVNFVDVARNALDRNIFSRAVEAVENQFADQPLLQARLLQDLALTMRELGLLNAAIAPQERAVELYRRELGEENTDTLDSINHYGLLQQALGHLDEAVSLYREVIRVRSRTNSDNDEATLQVQGNVATILRLQGKLDDAEALARTTLDGLRAQLGPDNPDTLNAMELLGGVLFRKGEYDKATQLYREAIERHQRIDGDDDPKTLNAMSSLASVLEEQGKYDESSSLARAVLEGTRQALGDDHPKTISAMVEYATRLGRAGRYDEAEPLLRETVAKRRRLFGDDHHRTVNAIEHLASVLADSGKYVEAEALFRQSLDLNRRIFGDDNPAVLKAMSNLGYSLSIQGNNEAAEPYYRDVLAGLRRVYGVDHPWTLSAMGNLATLLTTMEKYDEAEPLYLESLEARRRLFGDDNPSTLNAVYNMGNFLMQQGKLAEAEPYCRDALESYRRVGGDDHIGTLYSLANLGMLLMKQGKPDEAEPYFREAVERRRRINGDDNPETVNVVNLLIELLESQGRWADAEEWLRFLKDNAARAEPVNEKRLANQLRFLGMNLLQQQRLTDAVPSLEECVTLLKASDAADNWRRWQAQSMLGEVVAADPQRYADAEALLLEAAENMTPPDDEDNEWNSQFMVDARLRLVRLYDAWGKPDQAAKWQAAVTMTTSQPSSDN